LLVHYYDFGRDCRNTNHACSEGSDHPAL